jgi:transcriptional regulator with XRE-family HTH domain
MEFGSLIGDRLRQFREAKRLSQGHIEKRTGLLRCYISRVENGHTVPTIQTLEKMAQALEMPLYQFFYDGAKHAASADAAHNSWADGLWGSSGKDARVLAKLRQFLARTSENDKKLLLLLAQKMAGDRALKIAVRRRAGKAH